MTVDVITLGRSCSSWIAVVRDEAWAEVDGGRAPARWGLPAQPSAQGELRLILGSC